PEVRADAGQARRGGRRRCGLSTHAGRRPVRARPARRSHGHARDLLRQRHGARRLFTADRAFDRARADLRKEVSSHGDPVRAAAVPAASFSRTKETPAHARAARSVLVFVVVYAALTGLGYAHGERYLTGWLPLFLIETTSLLPRGFVADSISLERRDSQRLIV